MQFNHTVPFLPSMVQLGSFIMLVSLFTFAAHSASQIVPIVRGYIPQLLNFFKASRQCTIPTFRRVAGRLYHFKRHTRITSLHRSNALVGFPFSLWPSPFRALQNLWTPKKVVKTLTSSFPLLPPPPLSTVTRYTRRFKYVNPQRNRGLLLECFAGFYKLSFLTIPASAVELATTLVSVRFARYPVYNNLVPYQQIIDQLKRFEKLICTINIAGMDDSFYANISGDELVLATPTMMRIPTYDSDGDDRLFGTYEDSPIRPRQKRNDKKNPSLIVTKAPPTSGHTFSQTYMSASDVHDQVQGTIFETYSPLKASDSTMDEFLNFSPEKSLKTNTIARNGTKLLQTVDLNEQRSTPMKEFIFNTPLNILRWGQDENQNPRSLSSNKLAGKSYKPNFIDPRSISLEDTTETIGPIMNVKSRSKPTMNERTAKRVCSGEISPSNGRLPLTVLEEIGNRASFTTENDSELSSNEDDCVVLKTETKLDATEARRRETTGLRQFSQNLRNFTAIDLSSLKSYSPKKIETIKDEDEVSIGIEHPKSEPPSLPKVSVPISESDNTPEKALSSPIKNEGSIKASKIPVIIGRRRASSDPSAPLSHFNRKENIFSSALRQNATQGYVPQNGQPRTPTPNTMISTISTRSSLAVKNLNTPRSITKAPPCDKVIFLTKGHVRAVSDPLSPSNVTDKPSTTVPSEESNGPPSAIRELQKLLVASRAEANAYKNELVACKADLNQYKAQLAASNEARKRALDDIEFLNAENFVCKQQAAKLVAEQDLSNSTKSVSVAQATTKSEPSNNRPVSSASTTTTSSRPTSSQGPAMRATRGNGIDTTTHTTSNMRPVSQIGSRAPPSRAGNRSTTTTTNTGSGSRTGAASSMGMRTGASSSMGNRSGASSSMGTRTGTTSSSRTTRTPNTINTSTSSSNLRNIPARPDSALARNPVRRGGRT